MANVLYQLDGVKVSDFALTLERITEGRYPEETNFELYLEDMNGEKSESPVTWGKYFSGRGELYTPWIEIYFSDEVKFESMTIKLSEEGINEELFQKIACILPPGGRIMVIYAGHEETEMGLERNIPPVATPIGNLLFNAGCVWFKDWYFSEGHREGNVKLQGEIPVSDDDEKKASLEIYHELTEFLEREKFRKEKIFLNAKSRAESLLKKIENKYPQVRLIHI